MKGLYKINLILFPYVLFGLGLFVLFNGFPWMFFMIAVMAFVSWGISMKDLERIRIMEYIESTKVDPRELRASQETIDKIMDESSKMNQDGNH
jgi:hypothetical protein